MYRAPVIKLAAPVSVLMPVCNEADVIKYVLQEWIDDVLQHLPEGSEFILDDGRSTDGTLEIIEKMAEQYPCIRVLKSSRDGFAAAARRLYQEAKCPYIFFTDSDGQYIASDFWKLAPYMETYDLIHGAKIGRKDTALRRYASSIFNKLSEFLFAVTYSDINSAYRLMRKEVIDRILPQVNCMPTLLNAELLLRAEFENLRIKQVYVLHRVRRFGISRGLPPYRFLWDSLQAVKGLLKIKESYRIRTDFDSESKS